MIVNLIVIFLILFFGFIYSRGYTQLVNSDHNRKKYIRVISFILILQSGLRNVAVGEDTYGYSFTFVEAKESSWESVFKAFFDYYHLGIGKDPGYNIFQKIIQLISNDFQVYLFIIALIFFSALGYFLYKNTTRLIDLIIAFVIYSVLFYSFYSITGIRQTLATSFTLYSYEFVKKRKIIPFLILVLVASTIHKTAVIFIPFYFIAHIKKPKYFYNIILVLFPVFMVFKNDLANLLKVIGGYKEYNEYEGAGTFTFTVIFLLISIVALVRSKIILKQNHIAQHFYNAFAFTLLFLPLSWVNPSALRIVMYFSIFMLLFIPEIIYSFSAISKKIKTDLTVITIILLIVLFMKSNISNEIRYGFFWEDMKLSKNYNSNE